MNTAQVIELLQQVGPALVQVRNKVYRGCVRCQMATDGMCDEHRETIEMLQEATANVARALFLERGN